MASNRTKRLYSLWLSTIQQMRIRHRGSPSTFLLGGMSGVVVVKAKEVFATVWVFVVLLNRTAPHLFRPSLPVTTTHHTFNAKNVVEDCRLGVGQAI